MRVDYDDRSGRASRRALVSSSSRAVSRRSKRYYYVAMRDGNRSLEPETIETTEVVWEGYIGAHLRTGVSLFHYDADDLIVQRTFIDPATDRPPDSGLYYSNAKAGSSASSGRTIACVCKINNKSAEAAGLKISSRLLQLADDMP